MKERILIKKLKKKDETAFEELFNLYLKYVKTVVYNASNSILSGEDMEEVVADVFISLWKNAENIDETKESLQPYIAVIAKNLVKNKKRSIVNQFSNVELTDIIKGCTDPSLKTVIQDELRVLVLDALTQLNYDEMMCLLKFYYYSLSIMEIAEELDMKESTVKSKLSRGRKKLKLLLTERGISYENIYF